jgi:mannosyltransferase
VTSSPSPTPAVAGYATERPAWRARLGALAGARYAVPLGLGLLIAVSLYLRTRVFGVGFWIDEGISVGIADRPLLDVFDALRMDGSPPLYYLLLHFWMPVAGRTEEATHALSLLFALASIPVAWWGARAMFGDRAGWTAALLAAVNPFLTQYAQETRMYALVALLGLVACTTFACTFVLPEEGETPARGWPIGLVLSLAALLYTHNWALFFCAATVLAWCGLYWLAPPAARRRLLRRGALVYGAVVLLYLPWVPSTLYQAAHTGAPWSLAPGIEQVASIPTRLAGGPAQVALLLAAGSGVVALLSAGGSLRRLTPAGRATAALVVLFLGTLAIAFASSQISPAWANRYLAIALPPLLLLAAGGLAAAGRLGLVGLLLIVVLWAVEPIPDDKSNVRAIANHISPSLAPGDVVVSTQPEQIPVLHYYLPEGLRYTTLWGPVSDLGVADWRDGVERLEATSARKDLRPIMDAMPVGGRLLFVRPRIWGTERWSAPWTSLIRLRSQEWEQHVLGDRRFEVASVYPVGGPRRPNPVQSMILIKARR